MSPPPVPRLAMVLAAGRGTRLRPITDAAPKPLVEVAGRTLIDRILDRLGDVGIETVVVNTHYKGEMLERHLGERRRPRVVLSRETELLDTGGGVKKALSHLGNGPFYAVNGDVLWTDGVSGALAGLAAFWEGRDMDALLLVYPTIRARDYMGRGDFHMDPRGRLWRRSEGETAPFLFTGVQILHPCLFAGTPEGPFSLNLLYDRALAAGRLFGRMHDGQWYHVGTSAGIEEAEAGLSAVDRSSG